ncbi:MAG: nucleotidyltransferase domain-containing protein [Gammaproteobacteria bacterium]|nr:nucleotidyltransferase domain-containing protein [Gammaproteobacteria bacterium]
MKTRLPDALFSQVLQRVLALLYGQSERAFYTNEIIRLTYSGTGAVQRELKKLSDAGLITVEQRGNQKHYQANHKAPIFSELRSIVLKTCGLSDLLIDELKPVNVKIHIAFIYGSVAKGQDTAKSDVDLMIISDDLSYAELFPLLEKAENKIGRTINPSFYTPSEWIKKIKSGNNFVNQLINQPKIFLKGDKNELAKFK